jgi:hypothetical protein
MGYSGATFIERILFEAVHARYGGSRKRTHQGAERDKELSGKDQ